MDQGRRLSAVYFAAKVTDIDVEYIVIALEIVLPYMLEYYGSGSAHLPIAYLLKFPEAL